MSRQDESDRVRITFSTTRQAKAFLDALVEQGGDRIVTVEGRPQYSVRRTDRPEDEKNYARVVSVPDRPPMGSTAPYNEVICG